MNRADDRVRVVDFGLARAAGTSETAAPGLDVEVTNTGELIGTPFDSAVMKATSASMSDLRSLPALNGFFLASASV